MLSLLGFKPAALKANSDGKKEIENSEDEVKNVDYVEVGKYLAVTMTREDVTREGLANVVPKRKEETGREISVAYLCNKDNVDKWKKARKPGVRQRRKMVDAPR